MKAGFFVKLAVVAGIAGGSLFAHGAASAACCEPQDLMPTSYQVGTGGGDLSKPRTMPLWSAPYSRGHVGDGPSRPLPVLMVIANQD